jgi:hypothetical protein
MSTEKDKKVQQLIEIAKKKKEAIAKTEKAKYLTNCNFRTNPDVSQGTNLHTVTSPRKLVDMLSFLIDKKGSFEKAAETLGYEGKFEWLGFTFEEWEADIKTKLDKINLKAEKKKLEELESRLDKLVSKEVREQMELEAIERELGI